MSHSAKATIVFLAALGAATGCVPHRAPESAPHPSAVVAPSGPDAGSAAIAPPQMRACHDCSAHAVSADLAMALEARAADLKARGGVCENVGTVLEDALTSGRITVRPYMWRVDGNLASAMAESSGELTIARDIDSLNVGLRRLDDVLRSAEHEAAHIAMRIPSGERSREARVDEEVAGCRGGWHR